MNFVGFWLNLARLPVSVSFFSVVVKFDVSSPSKKNSHGKSMRTGILARYEIKTKMARSKDGNDSWTFDDTNGVLEKLSPFYCEVLFNN